MSSQKTTEPNPLIGTPPAAMAVIEMLLTLLINDDESIAVPGQYRSADDPECHSKNLEKYRYDYPQDVLAQWRAARGEAGLRPWLWMHGGLDNDDADNGMWGEHPTREEALKTGLSEAQGGGVWPTDGKFRIAECRSYADAIDPEHSDFAAVRNMETIDMRAHGVEPIEPTEVKADELS